MWSLANEETLQGTATGASIMQVMQNLVHSLDSTRLCTAALNSWGSGFSSVLDVNGFNYQLGQQDTFHSNNPGWPIIGTETSSQITDRGMYTNDTVNGYLWGYDLNPVSWGETAEAWWQYYFARPWSSGGFCWTGFDYRGEPTPYGWPCINSHFGMIDTCGFPKDIFYYYQANWTFKPVLHLFPHWNWSTPGQPINVWVFGNCQTVELFTNGVSLGRQALNVQGHVEWDNVPYASGTLKAIGYNNGVAVITNTIVTTGAPAQIALWPDRSTILADGSDVSVVTVAILDAQGNVVPTASNTVTFAVSGGTIHRRGQRRPQFTRSGQGQQSALRLQRSGRGHCPVHQFARLDHGDGNSRRVDLDQHHHYGSRRVAAASRSRGSRRRRRKRSGDGQLGHRSGRDDLQFVAGHDQRRPLHAHCREHRRREFGLRRQ